MILSCYLQMLRKLHVSPRFPVARRALCNPHHLLSTLTVEQSPAPRYQTSIFLPNFGPVSVSRINLDPRWILARIESDAKTSSLHDKISKILSSSPDLTNFDPSISEISLKPLAKEGGSIVTLNSPSPPSKTEKDALLKRLDQGLDYIPWYVISPMLQPQQWAFEIKGKPWLEDLGMRWPNRQIKITFGSGAEGLTEEDVWKLLRQVS
jgi:hypothetical protein